MHSRDILAYLVSSKQKIWALVETELETLREDSIVYNGVIIMNGRGISSVLVRSIDSSEEKILLQK
jgi:hypothetical protein